MDPKTPSKKSLPSRPVKKHQRWSLSQLSKGSAPLHPVLTEMESELQSSTERISVHFMDAQAQSPCQWPILPGRERKTPCLNIAIVRQQQPDLMADTIEYNLGSEENLANTCECCGSAAHENLERSFCSCGLSRLSVSVPISKLSGSLFLNRWNTSCLFNCRAN
jgi:hypothetical protein